MIEVTSVQYKSMGSSSSKSPVKVTKKPLDPRSAFGFISDCVDHAFSNDLTSSLSSSVKEGSSSSDSKTGDHCCSGSKSSSIVPHKEVPIKDSKISKEPENCETKFDLQSNSEKVNSSGEEEKENNLRSGVTTKKSSNLNHWDDYQQPSTSKATVVLYSKPPRSNNQETEEEEEDEEEETYSDYDFDDEAFEAQFEIADCANQDSLDMPKPRSQKFINSDDDGDNYCSIENGTNKAFGDLSRLFQHLVQSSVVGPRSKTVNNFEDSDSDSDYEDTKTKLASQIMSPAIPKEELGELGIPRTQRVNKDGDPVIEKCTCYHHQVVSTK